MSNNSDPNQGPGWNVHDTPYGKIRSYDGDSSSSCGGGMATLTMVWGIKRKSVFAQRQAIMAQLCRCVLII